jgi:hypothetical protein
MTLESSVVATPLKHSHSVISDPNHSLIYAPFIHDSTFSFEDHKQWFDSVLIVLSILEVNLYSRKDLVCVEGTSEDMSD